jgi:hypothetical protein
MTGATNTRHDLTTTTYEEAEMATTNDTQIPALLVKITRKTELEPVFNFLANYIKIVDGRAGDRVFRAAAVSVVRDMLTEVDADALLYLSDDVAAWLGRVGDLGLIDEIEGFLSIIRPSVNADAIDNFVGSWSALERNEHDDETNNAAILRSMELYKAISVSGYL